MPIQFSAVIPTCDRADFLVSALRSVARQSLPPAEIIVVDNGRNAVDPATLPFPVSLIRTAPRIGVSKARNVGVENARCEYVAFLDDDDIWAPNYLERMAAAILVANPRPDCAIGRKDVVSNGKRRIYKCVAGFSDLMPALLYKNPGVGGQCIVARRDAFLEIGGFDTSLVTAEDRALVLDFIVRGKKVLCVPEAASIKSSHDGERLTDVERLVVGKNLFLKKYRHLMPIGMWLAARADVLCLKAKVSPAYKPLDMLLRLLFVPWKLWRKALAHGGGLRKRPVPSLAFAQIGDLPVSRIAYLKENDGNWALNKAGRLVAGGYLAQSKVKLYEAESPGHAAFIQAVSNHPELSRYFPRVFERSGRLLVTEWVHGTRLAPERLDKAAGIQLEIHGTEIFAFPPPEYDYWRDFIRPRFLRAAPFLNPDLVESVLEKVDAAWESGTGVLMHPDVTPANIVATQEGDLRIIDNELLTIGAIPELDVCNTAYSMGRRLGSRYADAYFRARGFPSAERLEVLRAAWLARSVGTAFASGKLDRIDALTEAYTEGKEVLPFRLT